MSIMSLLLPIVLSAFGVFFASFIAWTISPHHKPDFKKLDDEAKVLDAVRAGAPGPGQYMFPYCDDPSKMKDPEFKKHYEAGPQGWLTVWPGPPNMGRNMALSFLFNLVASLFVGYLGMLALDAGATFREVFRVTATAGTAVYCLGFIPAAIWFGKPGRALAMDVIDGLVYAVVTAVIFGLMWPEAAA
jgi:hypothetical protein